MPNGIIAQSHTEPIHTLHGLLSDYEIIEPLLARGELLGRQWAYGRALDPAYRGKTPTRADILELHRVMFGDLFDWAGSTRKHECGPGGKVPVTWPLVESEIHNLAGNLRFRVDALRDTN